jgi:uncharacterized membrane protein YagU involved in acid resistance
MTTRYSIGSGIVAGLIAGLVFMVAEMIMVPLFGGGSPFGPPRMIAAIGMGPDVLPPPATFDLGIMMVAMLIHFAMAAILGVVFVFAARMMKLSGPMMLLVGAIFGLIIYFVNFYGMTAVFPWFEMARNWISIVAHVIFGIVLAWWLTRGAAAA